MVDEIAKPCEAYHAMMESWLLPDALLGGTRAMRLAGTAWLPLEPKENLQRYSTRLERSILHNAYKATLRRLSGKPFSKTVQVKGEKATFPEQIQRMLDFGVDRRGRTLTQFCRPFFQTGVHYGVVHLLTDFPSLGGKTDLDFDRRNKIRPIFNIVSPVDLIWWEYDETFYGDIALKEIRIKSENYVQGKKVCKIKVYTKTEWQEYTDSDDKGKYVLTASGAFDLGYIPLRTFYVNERGVMCGEPALEDLAWQNLAHWQSYSDQRNILRIARIANIFFKGMKKKEITDNITSVGSNSIWFSESPTADGKYIEHSGAAIGAGRDDIKDIEARMEVLGMQPLVERSGDATATGKAIDEGNNVSDMQVWVTDCQAVIKQAFEDAFAWSKTPMPDDFGIDIFQDFNLAARYTGDMTNLAEARKHNWITAETYLREVKRRGLLSENVDIEDETEDAKQQEMDAGFTPSFGGGFGG